MTSYVGLFRGSREDGWEVSFPDLPGCQATGRSFKDAFEAAREALAEHLDDHEGPPRPRNTAEILIDAQRDRALSRAFSGAVMHWVPVGEWNGVPAGLAGQGHMSAARDGGHELRP